MYEKLEIQHSCRLQEEDKHDHRHDILDHDPVEALEAEPAAAVLDFLYDPIPMMTEAAV